MQVQLAVWLRNRPVLSRSRRDPGQLATERNVYVSTRES
jgi:hypothetical protein